VYSVVAVFKTNHRKHRKIPENTERKINTPRGTKEKVRDHSGGSGRDGKRRFKAKYGLELANEDRTRNKIVSRTAFVIEERREESDPKQRQTY